MQHIKFSIRFMEYQTYSTKLILPLFIIHLKKIIYEPEI